MAVCLMRGAAPLRHTIPRVTTSRVNPLAALGLDTSRSHRALPDVLSQGQHIVCVISLYL